MKFSWNRILLAAMLCVCVGLASGCAVALLGAGGAGGYAISRDEIEGIMDQKYDTVWDAALAVVTRKGVIKEMNKEQGKITADVDGSVVNVSVDKPTPRTSRLRVKARRGLQLFPNVKLAQLLYDEMCKSLEQ